jgi:hypothetical protein
MTLRTYKNKFHSINFVLVFAVLISINIGFQTTEVKINRPPSTPSML